MMDLSLNSDLIGWSLLESGVVFIASFVFLGLMFTTRKPAWGPLNDVTYVIALALIIPFLIGFYTDIKSAHSTAALIAAALGITGIVIIAVTQTRLVFKTIEFELNLRQGAFGSGLLGVGFILIHVINMNKAFFPVGLNWLGLMSGIFMAMGIPTGLFYGEEELAMTTGKLDWKNASKLAIAAVLSTFIGQIGLIAWVFWMGMVIINS
jgi:hypothetical protein